MTIFAKQLTTTSLVLVGTPPETRTAQGEPGEWLVNDGAKQWLQSNRQFTLLYEPSEVAGVYKEKE